MQSSIWHNPTLFPVKIFGKLGIEEKFLILKIVSIKMPTTNIILKDKSRNKSHKGRGQACILFPMQKLLQLI